MNILYITNHLNVGGITTYVLSLARGLKARGHNIYVASSGGGLLPRFIQEGLNYIPIPINTKKEIGPKILASRFKLLRALKSLNIHVIHSNSRTTQILGCLTGRQFSIPHISTCHGFFKRRLLRKIFPCWGLKVIAISELVREHLIKDFKVEEKNIRLIYNGIDAKRFREQRTDDREQRKKELGLGDGPVVGIVARLSDVKGHIYLIEAMKQVLEHNPKAQLLIVGEGKEKERLVKLVRDLKITDNVFFIPQVSDTNSILSIMDLFVMPSLKEGLGLSLMEAMVCGLCVIGTDVGGIKSLIQDGFNGRLVKPKDSLSLATTIIELLGDDKKRESFGREAKIFINQNFSLEKMILETERLYLECLNVEY